MNAVQFRDIEFMDAPRQRLKFSGCIRWPENAEACSLRQHQLRLLAQRSQIVLALRVQDRTDQDVLIVLGDIGRRRRESQTQDHPGRSERQRHAPAQAQSAHFQASPSR